MSDNKNIFCLKYMFLSQQNCGAACTRQSSHRDTGSPHGRKHCHRDGLANAGKGDKKNKSLRKKFYSNFFQLQAVVDLNVLSYMPKLLQSSKESIKKEACWVISNITAGTQEQIQAVIDKGLFPTLIDLLGKATFVTRKEAAWAVSNTTAGGSEDQVAYLVEQAGALDPMCNLLALHDSKIVMVALEFIHNVLAVGESRKVQFSL